MKAQAERLRELRDADPEQRREQMKEARAEFDASMKEILTAEQYTRWEKIREQMRPGPGGPGGPGNRNGAPGGPGGQKGGERRGPPPGDKPEKN